MTQDIQRRSLASIDDQTKKTFQLEYETEKKKKPKHVPQHKRERRPTKDELRTIREIERKIEPAEEEEIWFRHTHWQAKRKQVRAALIGLGIKDTALDRFDNCGGDCSVEYCHEEKRYRLRANYCKCRHCEPCQRAKANKMAMNLRNKLEETPGQDYRFITLTLKHKAAPLREQIDRLYKCFKALRKTRIWKETQRGGASMLEVKWNPLDFHGNPTDAPWHVHLHIISEGDYLQQANLAQEWYRITGDSFKADIRIIKSGKDAAHYVSKYITKGTNNEVWANHDAAMEWIDATKGVRTAGTFGTWRGFKLLENPKDEFEWTLIGPLSNIVRLAKDGDPYAVSVLRNLMDNVQYDPHKKRKGKEKLE